jgi:hypothetical protein
MTIKTLTTIELDAEITYSQICDTGLSIPDPFASITKPEFPEGQTKSLSIADP